MTHCTPSIRLLAIEPGTRYLGLAVFKGTRLLDWRVRRATAPSQRQGIVLGQRIDVILRPVLQRYYPQVLVFKHCSAWQRRQSQMVSVIAKHCQEVGQHWGLRVMTYPPEQVRQCFARGRRVTRLELARIIATDYYPFLAPWYERERKTPLVSGGLLPADVWRRGAGPGSPRGCRKPPCS